MIIKELVRECDISGRKYLERVDGGAILSQGMTGRWCVILHVGPEEIKKQGYKLMTIEEAEAEIEKIGGWLEL